MTEFDQPIARESRYGHFPWWPEDGDDWIHPDDFEIAKREVPGQKIWRADDSDGEWMVLHYGEQTLRVRPNLWVEVESEGLEIGDWVEVLSQMMKNEYRIGTICDMLWDEAHKAIRYRIECAGDRIPKLYARRELRPVDPIDEQD